MAKFLMGVSCTVVQTIFFRWLCGPGGQHADGFRGTQTASNMAPTTFRGPRSEKYFSGYRHFSCITFYRYNAISDHVKAEQQIRW